MNNNDYLINVIALGDLFLSNNKEKLEDVTDFIIRKNVKDGTNIDIRTTKDKFIEELVEIFRSDVSNLSDVSIYYISDNLTQFLSSINIF